MAYQVGMSTSPFSFLDPLKDFLIDIIVKNNRVGIQVSYRSTLCQLIGIGEDWIVRQRIYTSPDFVEDHYHFKHSLNASK